MTLEQARTYEAPFNYIQDKVYPLRKTKSRWWLHERPRPAMRAAIAQLGRYIVTPHVSKHRLFVWLSGQVIPDHQLIVFAREDDYFFGILHSKVHELWTRGKATQLREMESGCRYTPTSTFETFPFPWPPGQEPTEEQDERVVAIAQAARALVALRQAWLHPPQEQIGVTISQRMLNQHTLTNLYNALTHYRENVKGRHRNPAQWDKDVNGLIPLGTIEELDHIHTTLDRAVLAAYGWPPTLTDDQILEHLLALNLHRANAEVQPCPYT